MTKFLLIGAELHGNIGGQSVMAFLDALRQHIPDFQATLLTGQPQKDIAFAEEYGISIMSRPRASKIIKAFCRTLLYSVLSKLHVSAPLLVRDSYIRAYAEANMVLDIAGIGFTDYFPSTLATITRSAGLLIGVLLGRPVVKCTQDMGPFTKPFNRAIIKFCLSRLSLIMVRSEESLKHVNSLGIKTPIYCFPDSAFLLKPSEMEHVEQILHEEGMGRRPFVGIVVTQYIDRQLSGKQTNVQNEYTRLMGRLADYMVEAFEVDVAFIPNLVGREDDWDDVFVGRKAYQNVRHKKHVSLIERVLTARELRGILKTCEIVVASRYHSVIASLSVCTPLVVVGWGFKYREAMKLFGLEDKVMDYRSVTYQEATAKIDEVWQQRQSIHNLLRNHISNIIERVYSTGLLIRDVLQTSSMKDIKE